MTVKVKYLILGGGPSGLALAARLLQLGERSFLVLEKEGEAGGLCRSKEVDGSPLDIGGGHFLDVRRKNVLDFVFQFLPQADWELYSRITKIRTPQFEIDYPYEANIWQLPVEDQVKHLMSIMKAGSNQGIPMPKNFRDWITWKLGDEIAKNYMLPYNAKIFSPFLDDLGTYWLEKLPDVSFEDTLRSCLERAPRGKLPAHGQFYYPKQYGYGELFTRIGESIKDHLLINTPVVHFDVHTLTINHEIQTDWVISTIPWQEIDRSKGMPAKVSAYIQDLKYSSIDIVYRPQNDDTNAHWIYFPDDSLSYHRILYRHNFLKGSHGYWEEVNPLRLNDRDQPVHHNRYAYPLNTRRKIGAIKKILDWARSLSIIGLGRWGEWEHMNSDVAMEKSLKLAEQLTGQK